MNTFSATVQIEMDASLEETFQTIVPIDLPTVFPGYGPLPAVKGTRNQTGGWDAAGQTRTVLLSDGSSANEIMTKYEYPRYFSYTVSGFTGILRWLTPSANGEWWFEKGPRPNTTHIRWRYAFNIRSLLSAPVLWLITTVLWRGYMRKSLMLCKAQVEGKVRP
jgi:hypothetical protein